MSILASPSAGHPGCWRPGLFVQPAAIWPGQAVPHSWRTHSWRQYCSLQGRYCTTSTRLTQRIWGTLTGLGAVFATWTWISLVLVVHNRPCSEQYRRQLCHAEGQEGHGPAEWKQAKQDSQPSSNQGGQQEGKLGSSCTRQRGAGVNQKVIAGWSMHDSKCIIGPIAAHSWSRAYP